MRKQEILKLNASMLPIGISDWKSAMVDLVSGAAHAVDVSYEMDDIGQIDRNKIEGLNIIRDFNEWIKLPVRPYDESVKTPKSEYRLPPIIVAAKYNKIHHKKVVFPTKTNIWNRDNWTCQYTGEKLTRDTISVDHILPVSRGGQNTWENLVTASKAINVWKSDRTPKECGLKLLSKPTKPKNGMIFDFMRAEWEMFLTGGKFD